MLCAFSLAFALCGAFSVAFGPTLYAQQTKSQLNTEVTTNLPDNTTGLITPAILRTTINDIIASFQQAPATITRASATDTILVGDFGQLISYTASPVAVTLPQATGSFANFNVFIKASNGPVTVTPTTSTIDGNASLLISASSGAWIVSNSGNYTSYTSGSGGGGGGTGTVTSVTAGAGLVTSTGNPITATGTLFAQTAVPGGRLTLTSGVAVSGDVAGATNIYYAPYTSPYVPIYNGTVMRLYQFTSTNTDIVGLTITLGSNWTASSLYDVFIGLDGSTVRACTGPAWSSSGNGSSSRGSGAGTTELQYFLGLWTNKNSMTCRYNNTTTLTCAANQCTLVGTAKLNSSKQADDTVAFRHVSNAYNAVRRPMRVIDSTATWSYGSAAVYAQANNSAANQLSFVQSLAGGAVDAVVQSNMSNGAANVFGSVGIDLNTLNTTVLSNNINFLQYSSAGGIVGQAAQYAGVPAVEGSNVLIWKEMSAATSTTWYGAAGGTILQSGIFGGVNN